MPTPGKPANVIELEGKSHRTKKELQQRKEHEKALLTGIKLKEAKEVKENEAAHKEFLRLQKLLASIEKNDDLYGNIINRYCLMKAECSEFEEKRERIFSEMCQLEEDREAFAEIEDLKSYYSLLNNFQKNIIAIDRQLQTKRRMLLDIEKENIMTIASALRSVPKKVEQKTNALLEALAD